MTLRLFRRTLGVAGKRMLRLAAATVALTGSALGQALPPPDLPPIVNKGREWKIVKEAWTQEDEKGLRRSCRLSGDRTASRLRMPPDSCKSLQLF